MSIQTPLFPIFPEDTIIADPNDEHSLSATYCAKHFTCIFSLNSPCNLLTSINPIYR